MPRNLLEVCTHRVIRDDAIDKLEDKVPKTCLKAIRNFEKEAEDLQDRYAECCEDDIEIKDIAMTRDGHVDVEETLRRLKISLCKEDFIHLYVAIGNTVNKEMWDNYPEDERSELISANNRVDDDDDEEEEHHLLRYRFLEYHKKTSRAHWFGEDKLAQWRRAFEECLTRNWQNAALKLFQEIDSNPREQSTVLVDVCVRCLTGEQLSGLLANLVEAKSVNTTIEREQFEREFSEIQLNYTAFKAGIEKVPKNAWRIIPGFNEWASERLVALENEERLGTWRDEFDECLENEELEPILEKFKQMDGDPEEQSAMLLRLWMKCFSGSFERGLLENLVDAKGAFTIIDREQFQTAFDEHYNHRNLDSETFRKGTDNIPKNAASMIPDYDEWVAERKQIFEYLEQMKEEEEMERVLQESREAEERRAAEAEAAELREAERVAKEAEMDAELDAVLEDFGEWLQIVENQSEMQDGSDDEEEMDDD